MTICIAAVCQQNDIPRVILCADWKEQSTLGSRESADKFHKLKPGWIALGAGTSRNIALLVREYQKHFRAAGEITDENIAEMMRVPLRNMKKSLNDEYIQGRYAMSYDEFLDIGRDKFPPEVFKRELEHLADMTLDAHLIIVGFTGDEGQKAPNICMTDSNGLIHLEEHYTAIGEGDLLAIPSLNSRECNMDTPMTEAIYYVYEAKVAAEKMPSVGEDVDINIINASGHVLTLTEEGWDRLDKMYKKYHPKIKEKDFEMISENFESSELAEKKLAIRHEG
jgi:20S proteasome alpha/beta subunit